jgi:hypothetical protein
MKQAVIVALALGVILIAGVGIVSQLRDQRQAAPERRAANGRTDFATASDASAVQPNQPRRGKRELQDPAAREALSLVGADAKAEEYWLKAVNNPNLPAKEREDLIEDLNEVGFSDPKNLSANDLPLILKRIALVEKLEAMDDVNAAAIKEAHKDLTRMRDRLQATATAQ